MSTSGSRRGQDGIVEEKVKVAAGIENADYLNTVG